MYKVCFYVDYLEHKMCLRGNCETYSMYKVLTIKAHLVQKTQ